MGLEIVLLEILTISLFLLISLILLGRLWCNLRDFFHSNYSFFEIIFVTLYFLEQAAFTWLYYNKQLIGSDLLVGLFTITVLTTVSFEKLTMGSRDRRIAKLKDRAVYQKDELVKKNEEVLEDYNKLNKAYEELSDYVNFLESKVKKNKPN